MLAAKENVARQEEPNMESYRSDAGIVHEQSDPRSTLRVVAIVLTILSGIGLVTALLNLPQQHLRAFLAF